MRKTPCPGIHRSTIATSDYFWCHGCGEWEIVNGKPVRPSMPQMTTSTNQGGYR